MTLQIGFGEVDVLCGQQVGSDLPILQMDFGVGTGQRAREGKARAARTDQLEASMAQAGQHREQLGATREAGAGVRPEIEPGNSSAGLIRQPAERERYDLDAQGKRKNSALGVMLTCRTISTNPRSGGLQGSIYADAGAVSRATARR